jgi:gliding motility-associated lipoprotein GldJ
MQFTKTLRNLVLLVTLTGAVVSCNPFKKKSQTSTATGMNYNDKSNGNFYVPKPKDIKTAPGLVFVQGGTFDMGQNQEDVMGDWNNMKRRVTVNSFFIDKTEVTNLHYREYIFWLSNVFPDGTSSGRSKNDMDSITWSALPDTLVWRSELAYNEPMVEYYLRHPSYNNFPVVGVSWKQATDYCIWRTDRVNELTLMKSGYLDPKTQIQKQLKGTGQDNFNTKSYLVGEYQATPGKDANKKSNPLKTIDGKPRTKVGFEDGILFGDYRLPTEAEWEYAAHSIPAYNPQSKSKKNKRGEELISNRATFSWPDNGFDNLRYTKKGSYQGALLANFKRGNGDYMGVAGGLNDNAAFPAGVDSYLPNGFGLYNMAGNVSEWVADVYKPMNSMDVDDLNPFRGNTFKQVIDTAAGSKRDEAGRIIYKTENDDSLKNRRNYQKAYAVNYKDGDDASKAIYKYGENTLISDKSHVVKGGSWNDIAYWLSPGTRRHLEEDQSTNTIGFRCAMNHYGPAEGTSKKAKTGIFMPTKKNKR